MNPFTLVLSPEHFKSGKAFFDRIVGFLIDSAVLYYVSCCLLLYGVYARFPAPAPRVHAPWVLGAFLARYCQTYGIFLLYVIVLTGLCLLVLRRLSLAEDGLVMAGMSLLLVLDPTFFNNVFYTFSVRLGLGLAVNSFCFVLAISLYAALVRVGGVPCTKRSATVTALAAAFVYYYPAGLNAGWQDATVARYFSLLWWMPLVIATICERMIVELPGAKSTTPGPIASEGTPGAQAVFGKTPSGRVAIPARMRRRFLIADTLIVFYIILSHLFEANYAYDLAYHVEYFTPVLLAAGLLLFKLIPGLSLSGLNRPFLWVSGAAAAYCACWNTDSLSLHLPHGFALSPFRYGFVAVALYFFYFWRCFCKTTLHRSWAISAIAFLLLGISGPSLQDSVFNIFHFQFAPFFFLALVLAVCAMLKDSPAFFILAGGCLLISILALTPLQDQYKAVIFLQAWAIWIGFVQWRYYPDARQWIYSLLGGFVFSLAAVMCFVGSPRWAWRVDYALVIVGLFCAGRFLKNIFLWTLSLLGTLAAPLYLARNQLGFLAGAFPRIANPGLLATMLAFLMLPLAYFLSVLKKRRLG